MLHASVVPKIRIPSKQSMQHETKVIVLNVKNTTWMPVAHDMAITQTDTINRPLTFFVALFIYLVITYLLFISNSLFYQYYPLSFGI